MKQSLSRCPWPVDDLYVAYHDTEWGVPLHDDRALFEFLILEGAQAGLSWHIILKKRENYRKAFDQFDPQKVARYNAAKLAALLANPGIIRNRLKIVAARTRESDAMSKDLKQRGFTFVGSTICYAHMQATGMVNDHLVTCFRHRELKGGK